MSTSLKKRAGLIGPVSRHGHPHARYRISIDAGSDVLVKIPMGRPGTVTEVAEMLAWMVSPACSFTTGFAFDLSGVRATY